MARGPSWLIALMLKVVRCRESPQAKPVEDESLVGLRGASSGNLALTCDWGVVSVDTLAPQASVLSQECTRVHG